MNSNYKFKNQVVTCTVLLGLILQSCNTFSNQLNPQIKKSKDNLLSKSDQMETRLFSGQEFVAEKGYLVSFHEHNGDLQANINVDVKQKEPNYKNLPVALENGTHLSILHHLNKQLQQRRIQIAWSSTGKPTHIYISKGGLKGGMMEGDEEKYNRAQEQEDEGEQEPNLFELAIQGNAEAQYQLGEKAYYTWLYQYRRQAQHEAKFWLNKAADQKNREAIYLLSEMNEREEEIESDNKLKKLLIDCARLNLNKFLPIIYKRKLDIQYRNRLGGGAFGDVYKAIYQGKIVAVKKLRNCSPSQFASFQQESIIMANHRHPNLITFLGFCPAEKALVMEYALDGSLWGLLKSDTEISWKTREKIALDVVEAMCHLHSLGVLHRDLKSENILLTRDGKGEIRAKVTDFGSAALKDENYEFEDGIAGTYRWTAPELINTENNTQAGDVYSYGMVLWQLGTRKEPFAGLELRQIIDRVLKEEYEVISDDTPKHIKKAIKLCRRPELERPTMKQIRHQLEAGHPNFIDQEKEELISELERSGKEKEELLTQSERLGKEKEELATQLERSGKEKEELLTQSERLGKEKEELATQLERFNKEKEKLRKQLEKISIYQRLK